MNAISKKAEKIQEIYRKYVQKINDLRKKQGRTIDDFIKKLEEEKMKEIINKIKSKI